MKRLLKGALLVLTAPLLFSCCAPKESTQPDSFRMLATVTDIGERIEVDVTEAEYASGIYWVITSDVTKFLDSDGKKIGKTDIKVGDLVEIIYNGQVMMSYPPQIVATRMKKI